MKQQQQVKRVVDALAGPVVAVVPAAHFHAVQAGEFRGKDVVYIRVGVAAEGGISRIDADVVEVVEPREQAHLAELAHSGDEGQTDVGVGILDHRVQVAQGVAHLPCHVGAGDVVEYRLVVFINEHHHTLAAGGVRLLDEFGKNAGNGGTVAGDAQQALLRGQHFAGANIKVLHAFKHTRAEADANHRAAPAPVPLVMHRQTPKQRLVAGKKFGQGVEKQAFAKTAGAAQKVMLTLGDQLECKARFVHVIAVVFPDFPESLDADGQLAARQCLGAGNGGRGVHQRILGARRFHPTLTAQHHGQAVQGLPVVAGPVGLFEAFDDAIHQVG